MRRRGVVVGQGAELKAAASLASHISPSHYDLHPRDSRASERNDTSRVASRRRLTAIKGPGCSPSPNATARACSRGPEQVTIEPGTGRSSGSQPTEPAVNENCGRPHFSKADFGHQGDRLWGSSLDPLEIDVSSPRRGGPPSLDWCCHLLRDEPPPERHPIHQSPPQFPHAPLPEGSRARKTSLVRWRQQSGSSRQKRGRRPFAASAAA